MMTLNDGRSELWQWDTNRKLTVDAECSQVHFSNKVFGRSVDVDVVDGIAVIPDILLQTDKELTAWAFVGTPENGYTKISKTFNVNPRNKPADYVFTPQDQSTLGDILDRIEDLENRPSGDISKEDIQNAVNDYLDKNPVSFEEKDPTVPAWAKKPNKPTYTAAEVGALPVDTVIPEGGIPIPPTASVGQTIVVKAVDENGKPTEWEATNISSGKSSSQYRHIRTIELEEEVSQFTIDTDDNGDPFNLEQILIVLTVIGAEGNTETGAYNFYVNNVKAGVLTTTINNGIYKAGASVKSALECLYVAPGHYLYTYANNSTSYRQHCNYGSTESITSFNIYAKTNTIIFGVGTKIVVLGVDK